jgi:hypothetical protein
MPFLYGTYMDWCIQLSVKTKDENLISYVLRKNSSGQAS